MKFERAALPVGHLWSSPFVRWQGALQDVSSIDLAAAVTNDALDARGIERANIDTLVLGTTVPQASSFYAAPWLAARLKLPSISGPHLSQACATSVACLVDAAMRAEVAPDAMSLVVTSDRTSNGPLLVYPRNQGMGGSPAVENWVLDNFAADPNTGQPMIATAENVARDGGMSRERLDELTLLRWQQYRTALADDRRVQRAWMQPVRLARGKAKLLVVEEDQGVHPYTTEGLARLAPVQPGGVVTYGMQTHPADGCAGAVVTSSERAKALDREKGTVRLLAAGFARAGLAEMPKAATLAAERALVDAGLTVNDLALAQTHNPFVVNDLWFHQRTGFDLERMNVWGSSLVYGHPQGPTGLRGVVELVHALRERGGGIGLFTGCAAGDTGAALVLRVD